MMSFCTEFINGDVFRPAEMGIDSLHNLLMAQEEENRPDSWPLPMEDHDAHAPFALG